MRKYFSYLERTPTESVEKLEEERTSQQRNKMAQLTKIENKIQSNKLKKSKWGEKFLWSEYWLIRY